MKKIIYFPLFILMFFVQSPLFGVHSHQSLICPDEQTAVQQISLDRSQIESQLGRKLKFKERIGFSILSRNLSKSQAKAPTEGEIDGFAIAGFVLGVLSLFIAGIALGILAIVFSAVSLGRIQKHNMKGKGFAIAGLVLGIVGVVGAIIVLAA